VVNQLTLSRPVLRGVLNGKVISCILIPSVPVPKGDYLLLPAVNHPLFGPAVRMVAIGQEGSRISVGPAARFAQNSRDSGTFIPSPEDEVLVAFNHGDMRNPVVLGDLWNGSDSPPESAQQPGTGTLPARSGIRVAVGFAHLIEALKSGPVRVKVK